MKKTIAATLIIIISIITIGLSKEKRTVVTKPVQKTTKIKANSNLVPSGRWSFSSRWHIGSTSRWNLYNLNKNTVGKWIMPWSSQNKYHYSNIKYKGYYGSKIPYAPRYSYRPKTFRPHYYFGRFKSYKHYYPYGYFHRHLYPRYFTSYWVYPFWAWYWYPSWWINYNYTYYPSYYYYEHWYPRTYYRPDNPYTNKYYARIITDINPEEALIYIDGAFIGTAEDYNGWWTAYPVKAGKHEITIKHPDYLEYSTNIELAPKQLYELKHKMIKINKNASSNLNYQNIENINQGSLILNVNPSNAELYINHEYIGTISEILSNQEKIPLTPGKYKITILSPTYVPYNTEIEIKDKQETIIKVDLIKKELI